MSLKKMMALGCAVVLTVAALAACGGNTEEEPTEATEVVTEEVAEEEGVTENASEEATEDATEEATLVEATDAE